MELPSQTKNTIFSTESYGVKPYFGGHLAEFLHWTGPYKLALSKAIFFTICLLALLAADQNPTPP